MDDARPSYPVRRSPRLAGYDYSLPGASFVTIVTQGRLELFGAIADRQMQLNAAGSIVADWWRRLPAKFGLEIDEFIVMPNHLHGLLCLRGDSSGRAVSPIPLPRVIQWFKTMTTNAYMGGVERQGWTRFAGKLWQRSFHDRVVRDDEELNRIRQYVLDNPSRWAEDRHNPPLI